MTNKYEDKLESLINTFGEMRNLSDEEQKKEYNEILDELFEYIGINLFDLLD